VGRVLRLTALLAFCALVVVGSGSSKGSATFHDAVGDHPAGRPDIDTVSVSNDDYGSLTFEVAIRGERLLSPGDFFFIFLDDDLNESTGSHVTFTTLAIGADRRLRAIGTAGFPEISDCTWNGSQWAGCKLPESSSDMLVGENMHAVRFTIRHDSSASSSFRIFVGGTHVENGSVTTDGAPDGAEPWRYKASITPDFDGDGLRGDDDKCPRVNARGKLDRNHNGCPGPFQRIRPVLKTVGVATGGATTFRRFALLGLPPAANVVLSSGSRREQLASNTNGAASSKQFKRRFADGTKITIRATKARFVGYYARYRIRAGAKHIGPALCLPAYGRQKPTPCTTSLLGK
jgi:hypothetical protein